MSDCKLSGTTYDKDDWPLPRRPAENERVKEIRERNEESKRCVAFWKTQGVQAPSYVDDIDYLLSLLPVQPAQIDPVNTYPTVVEAVQLLEAAGFGAVGKPNTLLDMVKEAIAAVQPAASTEAQDERKHDE